RGNGARVEPAGERLAIRVEPSSRVMAGRHAACGRVESADDQGPVLLIDEDARTRRWAANQAAEGPPSRGNRGPLRVSGLDSHERPNPKRTTPPKAWTTCGS